MMVYITFLFLKERFQLQTKQEKAGSSKPCTLTKTVQHFSYAHDSLLVEKVLILSVESPFLQNECFSVHHFTGITCQRV